ncbi:MAG: O-antigen ligase family protein [Clostridiales bacterium]|nr:O-antigen ligase family protein [Clostridiales bacterium]
MNMQLMARARKSAFVRRLTDFFYSPWYITAVGVAVLLCYSFRLDALGYAIIAVAAVFSCLFCDDATPLLPLLVATPFVESMAWRENGRVHRTVDIVAMAVCGAIVLVALLYHLIAYGAYKRIFRRGRLGIACIALAAGWALSGFFCPGYRFGFFAAVLQQIAFFSVIYFVLRGAVRWNKNSLTYLALSFTVMGLVMSCTLAETYLTYKPFIDSHYMDKIMLVTGWGMSNMIGPAILQTVPLTFYLAYKAEKHGWLFYLAAVLQCICTVFTYCRASALVGAVVFVACAAIVCVKATCRKQMWLCTAVVALLIGAALLWNETKEILDFYLQSGMDNRGRYPIWRLGMELFAEHPIFGVGFNRVKVTDHSYLFHNTIVQLMAASGAVGTLAYGYYRAQTVRLYTRRITAERLFLGITLAAIVLMSLLDNSIFRISIQVYMLPVLVFSERDLDYAVWFADCPRLGKRAPLFLR